MIILEICQKQPFDIIAVTPRGTLGLCFVHIAQLMAYSAAYTLLFTLQLCYKPFAIHQRVIKSQKVHKPSHNGLQIFKTSTLKNIDPRVSHIEDSVVAIHPYLITFIKLWLMLIEKKHALSMD